MKVRKFRILRLRHHVSMVELGRACGVSAQRGEKLDTLQQEYIACKNSLMERVGEYEYEL